MHHQIVLAQPAVAGEKILDRLFPHLRCDPQRIVCAGLLHCPEILHGGRIDAGLPPGRHPVHLGEKALRQLAGLVVHVPVDGCGQQQAMAGLEAETVNVGDQRKQRRICWPPWKMPNSPAVLISLTLFGGPAAIPMILAFEACAWRMNDDRSGVAKGGRTDPSILPPFAVTTSAASRSSEWPNA